MGELAREENKEVKSGQDEARETYEISLFDEEILELRSVRIRL